MIEERKKFKNECKIKDIKVRRDMKLIKKIKKETSAMNRIKNRNKTELSLMHFFFSFLFFFPFFFFFFFFSPPSGFERC